MTKKRGEGKGLWAALAEMPEKGAVSSLEGRLVRFRYQGRRIAGRQA
jgi:hypothetical protein